MDIEAGKKERCGGGGETSECRNMMDVEVTLT